VSPLLPPLRGAHAAAARPTLSHLAGSRSASLRRPKYGAAALKGLEAAQGEAPGSRGSAASPSAPPGGSCGEAGAGSEGGGGRGRRGPRRKGRGRRDKKETKAIMRDRTFKEVRKRGGREGESGV
jgi:hypothetical protein